MIEAELLKKSCDIIRNFYDKPLTPEQWSIYDDATNYVVEAIYEGCTLTAPDKKEG